NFEKIYNISPHKGTYEPSGFWYNFVSFMEAIWDFIKVLFFIVIIGLIIWAIFGGVIKDLFNWWPF
ncbi:MAG: hypothetical protein ACRC7B_02050, partial [Metamycoplasmataceae bacterium]